MVYGGKTESRPTPPRVLHLMRTQGPDVEERLFDRTKVPSGNLAELDMSELPMFRPQIFISSNRVGPNSYTPWALRFRLFREYLPAFREKRALIDGHHLSKRLAVLWLSLKHVSPITSDLENTVYAWPNFLKEIPVEKHGYRKWCNGEGAMEAMLNGGVVPVDTSNDGRLLNWPAFLREISPEERVFRKWCKDEEGMIKVLQRGLVAAHHGCTLRHPETDELVQFPYLEGTFLANPGDAPEMSNHDRFEHYVDFTLPPTASVLQLNAHKFILPGISRVHEESMDTMLTNIHYDSEPDELEAPLVGCARIFGNQFPEAFTPVDVVGYGAVATSATFLAGATACMSPIF